MAGVVNNGTSPFGSRYNVAAIASMLDTKRVHRGVVWETGTPIAWGRYAKVGIVQGSEPANGSGVTSTVNVIKQEIARALSTEQKHPAPAIANVTAATVRATSGSWTQDVSTYLGSGVTFAVPSVVVLAGWPEYGSVLPAPPPNSGLASSCKVFEGSAQYTGIASCGGGYPRLVKSWPHCESGPSYGFSPSTVIYVVPEIGGALTTGYNIIQLGEAVSEPDLTLCKGRCGSDGYCQNQCVSEKSNINSAYSERAIYGRVVLNATDAAYYVCNTQTWVPRASGGGYQIRNDVGFPAGGSFDSLCCLE